MVKGHEEMRAQFEHEDRRGQVRDDGVAAQRQPLPVAVIDLRVGGLGDQARLIAGLAHGGDQRAGRQSAEAFDVGALAGEVDAGRRDAGNAGQRLLHPAHAGGASHALDFQIDGACRHVVTRLADRLDHRRHLRRRQQVDLGRFGSKVYGDVFHIRQLADGVFDAAHAGGTGHAFDGKVDAVQSRHASCPCSGFLHLVLV